MSGQSSGGDRGAWAWGRTTFAAFLLLGALAGLAACRGPRGAYDAFNRADCLPPVSLIDQDGRPVVLASLKGKPVLVDFIYTSCPGPCLLLTQKMARVAERLAPATRARLTMVSITVDPEHDGPAQLAAYIRSQRVDPRSWYFMTGPPAIIERVMANFQLRREREADGSVAHVTGIFLLGADGHEMRENDGQVAQVATVVGDLQAILGSARG